MSWENLFMQYANKKGADQPAHQRSLISTFVVHCLDSIIPPVSISEMSSLYLASVAAQAGLSLPVYPGWKPRRQVFLWWGSYYFSTAQLWDSRKKGVLQTFQNTYQVTAVTFSDTAEQVISGGIDNDIKVRDKYKRCFDVFLIELSYFLLQINQAGKFGMHLCDRYVAYMSELVTGHILGA